MRGRVQVDIYSLGIITYELFMMCPLSIRVHKSGEPDEFPNYACAVAAGHRETLKPSWPQELKVMPPPPPSSAAASGCCGCNQAHSHAYGCSFIRQRVCCCDVGSVACVSSRE